MLALGLGGCAGLAVQGRGLVRVEGDVVTLAASSGRTRALRLDGDEVVLRAAEGLLVEVEGTLRRGDIDVDRWTIVEGPHGLAAFVGRLRADGSGLWLDRGAGDAALRLDDSLAPAPDAVGRLVLVEGAVDGPYAVRALAWRVLEARTP